jgi:SAM-dependent methyltransferase
MTNAGSDYNVLAPVYDLLQEDIDSQAWAGFIHDAINRHGHIPAGDGDGSGGRLIALDLGCGTGAIAVELVARGYDVIGIDLSEDMLGQARQKAEQRGIGHGEGGLSLIRQDISDFELFGTVDLIVCLLDTVNHLPDCGRVKRMLRLCFQYLNPGGMFIFDIATPRHFIETLGNQVFYDLSKDVAMIWKNTYDPIHQASQSEIAIFIQCEDRRYSRYDAEIHEKAYPVEKVQEWVTAAGFETVARYADIDCAPVGPDADRVFFLLIKPDSNGKDVDYDKQH